MDSFKHHSDYFLKVHYMTDQQLFIAIVVLCAVIGAVWHRYQQRKSDEEWLNNPFNKDGPKFDQVAYDKYNEEMKLAREALSKSLKV